MRAEVRRPRYRLLRGLLLIMRVNVDSELLGDERMIRLASLLSISTQQAVGCLVYVWLQCYNIRSSRISTLIVDAHAGMSGFADAMVTCGLAMALAIQSANGTRHITVSGVEERVEFLRKQAKSGRRGAQGRWHSPSRVPMADPNGPSLSLKTKAPESGARVRAHGSMDPIPEPEPDPEAWRERIASGSSRPAGPALPYEPPDQPARPYTPRNGSYGAPRAAQGPITGSETPVRVCPECKRPATPPSVELDGKLHHYRCLYRDKEAKS
jgi:hypothetical protein